MEALISFFDINNIFFTFLGYDISYLEFAGTIFNLACVILAAKRKISSWPIGLIGVILFGVLFYKINLYADFIEQIFYFITGIWGWYMWNKTKNEDTLEHKTSYNSKKQNIFWLIGIVLSSLGLGLFMSNIHSILPTLFPEPASLPYLDSITTIMSFVAQILMMQKKVESWWLWIAVDIIAVGLYWYKQVPFVALLYAIFLVNAIYGYLGWKKSAKLGTNEEK